MSTTARLGLAGCIAGLIALGALATAALGDRQAAVNATAAVATTAAPPTAKATEHAAAPDHRHDTAAAAGSASTDAAPASPAARQLVQRTRRHLARWDDVAAAEADGFESIGDAITGHEHYVHWAWAQDRQILKPSRPESLVYAVDGDRRRLVSAMYILPPGSTMRDAPDVGDERAEWHRHTNLCWEGRRVAGLFSQGQCVPAGTRRATPPMLHVWRTRQPCGPFAGLGTHGDHCPAD